MGRTSAGLLMYRRRLGILEVLLAHPGGPFWKNKAWESWSIPKGEYLVGKEEALTAAKREFFEETGLAPTGDFIELSEVKQAGGKMVQAWAFEGDCNPNDLVSNTFTMVWPPRSGQLQEFPEVDRFAWFSLSEARKRILKGQIALLAELEVIVHSNIVS